MPWPFTQRDPMGSAESMMSQARVGRSSGPGAVGRDKALRHSAVWACRDLRASLISTMPVDVYRNVDGLSVSVPPPPVLQSPDGGLTSMLDWRYATQNDLDDYGNAFGKILARDGLGLPAIIEPVAASTVTVLVRGGEVSYRIGKDTFARRDVWHERQNPVSGSPVGLGVLGSAAASVAGYLSAQDFAANWFSGKTIPTSTLRNTKKTMSAGEADVMKRRFRASVSDGDVFVTGADWEYKMNEGHDASWSFLDERKFGIGDVCRFYRVPGDMIDAESQSSGSIKYSNITQKNLQLLIINLGPVKIRHEKKLSDLTPRPRFVKLNAGALMQMDMAGRYAAHKTSIDARFMAPSEVRALEDRPPFTAEQEAEFGRLFSSKSPTSALDVVPSGGESS